MIDQPGQLAGEADGLGREVHIARVPLVEHQVQDPEHRSTSPGRSNRTPETVRLARLMRCAIVDSGTRYASAICRVVSPPTARSVSATADAGVSVGWAHRKYSCRVSSAPEAGSGSGSLANTTSSRRSRLDSARRDRGTAATRP